MAVGSNGRIKGNVHNVESETHCSRYRYHLNGELFAISFELAKYGIIVCLNDFIFPRKKLLDSI